MCAFYFKTSFFGLIRLPFALFIADGFILVLLRSECLDKDGLSVWLYKVFNW